MEVAFEMNDNRKLQEVILFIAKEINKICVLNGINYSLDGGSLLGAIRHKGFIPWDDDFDIAMKRTDYEKFIKVCDEVIDKDVFHMQTSDNTLHYAFAFAKVHLQHTEIIEDFSKNANVHHGIFLDIFPYDNLPDNYVIRKIYLFANHILKNMIWVKCGYGSEREKCRVSYILFKILSRPFAINQLKSMRKRLLNLYNGRKTKYAFTADYPQNAIPNVWFDKIKKYDFEDTSFCGFFNAHDYLTMVYGDYMKLPPEEERVVHSKYKVDYGPYEYGLPADE